MEDIMSEHFTPLEFSRLFSWIMNEYKSKNSIFGIPQALFFKPSKHDGFTSIKHGKLLETPLGVAAGPHTQMTQNIISAWLCGARFIELKTIQTLDELNVSKPCIDMEDEGYNCEWSQELRLEQSYEEYLKAWVIIHILRKILGHDNGTDELGTIFNMSVGYNLEGIKKDNVQNFLKKMRDSDENIKKLLLDAEKIYPDAKNIHIPSIISDNITLSTMHGCPPDEIEKIAKYLISELGFHTAIKFNPTLLGKQMIRDILNEKLGFATIIPDIAFEHDPKYEDVLNIIKNVSIIAKKHNLDFGFKISNTLESVNHKNVFPENEKMMYMSGRALHPIDVNLASKMINDLKGLYDISFSGGADAFNLNELIGCNLRPVTLCSDILKPGGYGRLKQFIDILNESFKEYNAYNIEEFIINKARKSFSEEEILDKARNIESSVSSLDSIDNNVLLRACSMLNSDKYAKEVLDSDRYKSSYMESSCTKGSRKLKKFDCISAPCTEECPVDQKVPEYMRLVREGKIDEALKIVLLDNPVPVIAGSVCDHKCTTKCIRSNYEKPLAIREIKRFITENGKFSPKASNYKEKKVAIIGAGPAGLSCAYFLAIHNISVTIFEELDHPGGMAAHAIPSFRLPDEKIKIDIDRLIGLGVEFKFKHSLGKNVNINELKTEFDNIFIGTGAQKAIALDMDNNDIEGILDFLEFLKDIRNGKKSGFGKNIIIVGGGNSAMDVARSAWRLEDHPKVKLLYRRTKKEMPADKEEIEQLIEEGIEIIELATPSKLISNNGKLNKIECIRMKLGKPDSSGRRRPEKIPGSEFLLEADTLIPAISQNTIIDILKDDIMIKDNKIIVDDSGCTSDKMIFSGGDIVRGPATLIKAVGDGKKAALSILGLTQEKNSTSSEININDEIIKRSKKVFPEFDILKKPEKRRNFLDIARTLTYDEAITEAKRCLSCDKYCGICTTVCPNRANINIKVKCIDIPLEKAISSNGNIILSKNGRYIISQEYQILNIGDFCNECGNCTTFCPTSGAPYRDKITLFLSKKSFEDNNDDCFWFDSDKKTLYARRSEKIYSLLEKDQEYLFSGDGFNLNINKEYKVSEITSDNKNSSLDLSICYDMLTIITALNNSAGYLL